MTTLSPNETGALDEASRPVVARDALVKHYGPEAVAWSPRGPKPVYLDPVSAIIIQLLDGSATVSDLISDVQEVVGVPREIASNRIRWTINQLDEAAILTSSPTSYELPTDTLGLFSAPPNP